MKFKFLLLLLFPIYSYASNHTIEFSKVEIEQGMKIINQIKDKEWENATQNIESVSDPVMHKYLLAKLYSEPESPTDINYLKYFIRKNQSWPGLAGIQKKLEETLNFNNSKNIEILEWFKSYPPISAQGIKILAEAKFRHHIETIKQLNREDLTQKEEVRNLIKKAWVKGNFSVQEETDFLLKYDHLLSQADHISRIDRLLWDKQFKVAERIIHKVSRDYQKLFKARTNISENPQNIDSIIKTVPASLRYTPGLVYDLIGWYQKHEKHSKAVQLIKHIPKEHYQQKMWWRVRNRAIRELLDVKAYQTAYKMTRNYGKLDPKDVPEVEWLAGWISYSFLNKPQEAYKHFETIYKISQFPINKARGAYWAAKAAKRMRKNELAKKMFNVAANYNFTFYGQLASLKLNKKAALAFKESPQYSEVDKENFLKNEYAKVAYIAAILEQKEEAKNFILTALSKAKTEGEYFLIASMPKDMPVKWLSVHAAKILSFRNIILSEFSYPKLDFVKNHTDNEAFTHAIIRQESVFDYGAVSSAGATGMMQIMPHTGKLIAQDIGEENFSAEKLLDYKYNVKLGTCLLDKLLKQYNGSYILTAAAYNAGEPAVNRWIARYGDPRLMKRTKDILNWIEHIPYGETRNYVLRVLENMQVYKAITQKVNAAISLKFDLRGQSNIN